MSAPLLLGNDCVFRAPVLSELTWLDHGFGTRLSTDWPGQRPVATLKQIHSNRVVVHSGQAGVLGEADALVSNRPGAFLTIRTADCLPVLLADTEHWAVAAIHAGWRGTAANIVSETLNVMRREFRTDAANIVAVIGPGIANCCFEVGPEVAAQFRAFFPDRDDLDSRTIIDLFETNRRQLENSGVPASQVISGELCTRCGSDMFHSFRRDREASGRMIAGIGLVTDDKSGR